MVNIGRGACEFLKSKHRCASVLADAGFMPLSLAELQTSYGVPTRIVAQRLSL